MRATRNRGIQDRSGLRYPRDLSDAEWEIMVPMIPPAKRGSWPYRVNIRVVPGIYKSSPSAARGVCCRRILLYLAIYQPHHELNHEKIISEIRCNRDFGLFLIADGLCARVPSNNT